MDELKPCPRGHKAKFGQGAFGTHIVICSDEFCPWELNGEYGTIESAAEAWNIRQESKPMTVSAWQVLDDFLEGCESEQDIFDKLPSNLKTNVRWTRAKHYLQYWKTHSTLPSQPDIEQLKSELTRKTDQITRLKEMLHTCAKQSTDELLLIRIIELLSEIGGNH